jgi:hypothetical protein
MPRAAERRKVRSRRERVDVSSRGGNVLHDDVDLCVWYYLTILSYRTLVAARLCHYTVHSTYQIHASERARRRSTNEMHPRRSRRRRRPHPLRPRHRRSSDTNHDTKLSGYTKLYQAIPSYTKLYQAIPSYTKLYQAIPSYTRLYQAIPN